MTSCKNPWLFGCSVVVENAPNIAIVRGHPFKDRIRGIRSNPAAGQDLFGHIDPAHGPPVKPVTGKLPYCWIAAGGTLEDISRGRIINSIAVFVEVVVCVVVSITFIGIKKAIVLFSWIITGPAGVSFSASLSPVFMIGELVHTARIIQNQQNVWCDLAREKRGIGQVIRHVGATLGFNILRGA